MSFEQTMQTVGAWTGAVEALAALGAELMLKQSDQPAPPEIVAALRKVSEAAGIGDLDELAPPQRGILLAQVQAALHQFTELVELPGRESGWTFTDPVILDGWGRGSTLVPPMLAAAHEDLKDVTSFLDVGTGVGFLAIAAAGLWPKATIVGIDIWEPSLARARAHVAEAGLQDRITLREQNVTDVDDVNAYDAAWVPTFFLTESVLSKALPGLLRALRPGGWAAFGRFVSPSDPLTAATAALRTIRGGGADHDPKRLFELLEEAGFTSIQHIPPKGPMPIDLILGQKPS